MVEIGAPDGCDDEAKIYLGDAAAQKRRRRGLGRGGAMRKHADLGKGPDILGLLAQAIALIVFLLRF